MNTKKANTVSPTELNMTVGHQGSSEKIPTDQPAKLASALKDEPLPQGELRPEKQPASLPPGFDPTGWPHYSVQGSVYSLLLSALSLSEHFERFPGAEERRKDLEVLILEYQATCAALKFTTRQGLS